MNIFVCILLLLVGSGYPLQIIIRLAPHYRIVVPISQNGKIIHYYRISYIN